MTLEMAFRAALFLIRLLSTSIVVFHRLRAASSGERISHREEGYLFAAALRVAGICLWITTFAYLLNPDWVRWAAMPWPSWIRWFGAVVGVISVFAMYWTLSSLGANLTDTVVTRTNATLITQGPYRWVRHPFYGTAGLLMLSATLLSANWLVGVSSIGVMGLLVIRTPKEEQMLIDRFGAEYQHYRETTGRFFPRNQRSADK